MKATIDRAGRIVVPKAVRTAMGLNPGDPLEIDFVDGRIVIEYAPVDAWVEIASDGMPIIRTADDAPFQAVTEQDLRDALEAVRDEGLTEYV